MSKRRMKPRFGAWLDCDSIDDLPEHLKDRGYEARDFPLSIFKSWEVFFKCLCGWKGTGEEVKVSCIGDELTPFCPECDKDLWRTGESGYIEEATKGE